MNIRAVDAGRGFGWIGDGFGYFQRAMGAWLGITIVFAVIFIALGLVPFIGSIASQVLAPVFLAGVFMGCRAQDEGAQVELGHLFRGFSVQTGNLMLLGALYLASVIALVILLLILGFVALGGFGAIMAMADGQPDQLLNNLPMLLVVLLIGLGLYVPILMALWFAPLLVALGGLGVGDAVAASFKGCLANILPFLLWGVVMFVLAVLAAIPFMLGFLVLMPVIWGSTYVAYKEIFAP